MGLWRGDSSWRWGLVRDPIEHRVAQGRLHLVMRGVYAVGWPELTQKRRWMAAILAGGDGAALSHRSAAALWGVGTERSGWIDVSVRRRMPGFAVPAYASERALL